MHKYVYSYAMLFTWDEKKRLSNIKKHGIDFTCATDIFLALLLHGKTADLIMENNAGLPWGF